MGQRPLLSISLLASNRLDTIRRCLDSLKPIMEQLSCELILVDTSGNPKVHELLLEYTENVIEFTWCNDFAKARNAGLKRAKGEWFLFLDDDEWFVEIDELIRFFKSSEYKKYGCANYLVRNFYDINFSNYVDCWVSRMIRLDAETEFRSKVHEYLYPVKGKCKALYARVNHSGYIYATLEERHAHFERNSSLLLDMIKEEPDVLRWKVQLAQEYHSIKEWERLYEFCEECLENTKDRDNRYDNYDIGTFYSGAVESLLFLKRYEEALAMWKRAESDSRNSKLCLANLDLHAGVVNYRMERWDEAEACIGEYFAYKEELSQDETALNDQKTALLVAETFDLIPLRRAYSVLICCGLRKKNIDSLKKYYPKLEWRQDSVYVFDGILEALVDAAEDFADDGTYIEVMRIVQDHVKMRRLLYKLIQKKGEPFYLAVPYDLWTEGISRYLSEEGILKILDIDEHLNEIKTCEDIRFEYVSMRTAEVVLLHGWSGKGSKEIRLLLSVFAERTASFFQAYYQAEIMESYLELLPGYAQAAIWIDRALKREADDFSGAADCFKKAVEAYSELGEPIKQYFNGFEEMQQQQKLDAKKELQKLKQQIHAQVQQCVEQKQYDTALAILGQLKQMQPNDLELVEESLKIRLAML